MLNKEKYAKEIAEIACDGYKVAIVHGKPKSCGKCIDCDFYGCNDCTKKLMDWAETNMASRLLIGVKFLLTHRFMLDAAAATNGRKNILLNSRTIMCMRGAMAKHHGAPLMDLQ